MDLPIRHSRPSSVPHCGPGPIPEVGEPWGARKRRAKRAGAGLISEITTLAAPPAMRHQALTPIQKIMPSLRSELDRIGLKRVRLGHEARAEWQGAFAITGDGALEIVIGASLDPMKTLHHEVIHALRHMDLFTPAEWGALERAAVSGWIEKHDIDARYPDHSYSERIEEAIAEAFAEVSATGAVIPAGPLARAFDKIARLFRAFRNALRGCGFQTAEDVFGRVLAGKISARQAGDTGTVMRIAPAHQARR
ncbi:hypothetical protein [Pseudogemmobacter sonorensis]|uniref:hypothetical protein n=1 Tax=Pseudogemmobacter sonorensis TaxID=2989681 RepID=UPI0036A6F472